MWVREGAEESARAATGLARHSRPPPPRLLSFDAPLLPSFHPPRPPRSTHGRSAGRNTGGGSHRANGAHTGTRVRAEWVWLVSSPPPSLLPPCGNCFRRACTFIHPFARSRIHSLACSLASARGGRVASSAEHSCFCLQSGPKHPFNSVPQPSPSPPTLAGPRPLAPSPPHSSTICLPHSLLRLCP